VPAGVDVPGGDHLALDARSVLLLRVERN
jgi:hypothetical protein